MLMSKTGDCWNFSFRQLSFENTCNLHTIWVELRNSIISRGFDHHWIYEDEETRAASAKISNILVDVGREIQADPKIKKPLVETI